MPIALLCTPTSPPRGIDPRRLTALHALSAGAMMALTGLAPSVLHIPVPYPSLLTVAAALGLFILGGLALRRWRPAWPTAPTALHLAVDLLAWGLFIALTGGATNPLVSLMLPLVAIAAAALPERQAWALGGLAVVIYSLLWRFFLPLPIQDESLAVHLHLAGMWATFAVSMAVTVWFLSRMTRAVRSRDQALAAARERALRDDWVVSLGTLAAGAAHDLSTPLATLGTLIGEHLDDPAIQGDLRADLELAAVQVRTCKRALNELTARAGSPRAEGGATLVASTQPVDVWLRGLAESWVTLHPAADIALDLAPELVTRGVPQDLALDRAIHNLVDNAVLACPQGVEVKAGIEGARLWVRIADQGPGIQADNGGSKAAHGLGIGLLLARGAVERLGGELTLSPRPGGGTWASLRLPLAGLEGMG